MSRKKKVAAAVREIRAFHSLGRSLPGKRARAESYGSNLIKTEAERRGLHEDTLRKACQFVDPDEGYSRQELAALCELITRVQSGQDDDRPLFSRTHVVRLLSITKSRREKLTREAVEKAWSSAELARQIYARFGTRRAGGRRKRVPRDVISLLIQLECMCETWRRWLAVADGKDERSGKPHSAFRELPLGLRRQIRAAGNVVGRLQESITAELRARRPKREVRPQMRGDF